jgi:SAM-dependent methyltransferase
MLKANQDRVSAEKAFHNARFSEENLTKASKYYMALRLWYEDYFRKVTTAKAASILELGCGAESLAVNWTATGFDFTSIDISEEAVQYTEKNSTLPQAKFLVNDAHQMVFPDGSFDLIVGRGILHHLDLPVACQELKRVLRPRGIIIFGEPLDCNPLINIYRRLTPNIRSKDEQPLSAASLRMLKNQFGKLDVKYYGFLTLGPAILGRKSPMVFHKIDDILLNRLGMGRFLAWACLISSRAT